MLGIYFSATGNSRYASEVFLNELDTCVPVISIGDKNAAQMLKEADEVVFSYPVQYSAVPKIVRDFIERTAPLWQGKRVFVIATCLTLLFPYQKSYSSNTNHRDQV